MLALVLLLSATIFSVALNLDLPRAILTGQTGRLLFLRLGVIEALPGGCPRSLVGILKRLVSAFCQGYTTLSEI